MKKLKIHQVCECLDYGDAVSNQIINIKKILISLGYESKIYCKFIHDELKKDAETINTLEVEENDIVILHFSLYSEYAVPYVSDLKCTKILDYHNITPHQYFNKETRLYHFCKQGRDALPTIIKQFDFYWGDSEYNIKELVELGADVSSCFVIPIIVDPIVNKKCDIDKHKYDWIFIGRICENKNQLNLIKIFSEVNRKNPNLANTLRLVGGFDVEYPYYKEIIKEIDEKKIKNKVAITGKVTEREKLDALNNSSVYVSLSLHEGFGVPLIEASWAHIPVIALSNAAVPETLGKSPGLIKDTYDILNILNKLKNEESFYDRIIDHQITNSKRFTLDKITESIQNSLNSILPRFKKFENVSIVICSNNRANYLERCLDYLHYQINTNFEVIVVLDNCNDNSHEIVKRYKGRIKVVETDNGNLSKARNLGIEQCAGDIIAFIDDDAIPFDDWVKNIIEFYNNNNLKMAAAGGPVYYAGSFEFQANDNGINKLGEARVNIESNQIGRDGWYRYNTGTNCTFNASILKMVNGFDEQYDYYLDESDLCYRLQLMGYSVKFSKEILVRHEFARSTNRIGRWEYNWRTIVKNTAYFAAIHGNMKNAELHSYLTKKIENERIAPLQEAFINSEITEKYFKQAVLEIQDGLYIGLRDASHGSKIRVIKKESPEFTKFMRKKTANFKQLHVCILSKEFPPFTQNGGIGTLYNNLAAELLLMGHLVTIVTIANEDSEWNRGRFTIYFTKLKDYFKAPESLSPFTKNISWSLTAAQKISEIHSKQKIDFVDSALWDAEALALSMIKSSARPKIVTRLVTPFIINDEINEWNTPEPIKRNLHASENTLLKNSNLIIPISNNIYQAVKKSHEINMCNWNVVKCGISYWPKFDVNSNYDLIQDISIGNIFKKFKVILFIGRLELRKGIDLVFKAANEILESNDDVFIIIAGRDIDGWSQKYKSFLREDNISRIKLLGEVDDATKEKLLSMSYCLVFPSRYESFGLIPLEAYVHGIPVIGSNAGAIPEVVDDGASGLIFESGNYKDLAVKTNQLLKDADLYKILKKGAKEAIYRFSSRGMAKSTYTSN